MNNIVYFSFGSYKISSGIVSLWLCEEDLKDALKNFSLTPEAFDDLTSRSLHPNCNWPLSWIDSRGKAKEELTSAGQRDDLIFKAASLCSSLLGSLAQVKVSAVQDILRIQFDPGLAQKWHYQVFVTNTVKRECILIKSVVGAESKVFIGKVQKETRPQFWPQMTPG